MRRHWCAKVGVCAVVAAGLAVGADEPTAPEGKLMLFNGEDLSGLRCFVPDPRHDVAQTWSVREGVIRCTGKPAGYIRTAAAYRDYTLHVEWRWAGKPGNSGVLVHVSEPDKVWPRSVECQLMNRHAGDFFVIDGTDFKEHAGRKGRRTPKRTESTEAPPGEWNTMEVTCRGRDIRVVVNGALQNEATEASVSSGMIALQSEGAPIEFRNIYLTPAVK